MVSSPYGDRDDLRRRTMREIISSITSKGQVTIPREVREELGVGTRDKIAFVIDDGEVRIKPVQFTLESVIGSVPALDRPVSDDFETEIEEAFEEEMERKMRRWGLT